MTILYINNSDQKRFGSFSEELASQQSLKNDQYPWTILEAQEILDNRHWDKLGENNQPNLQESESRHMEAKNAFIEQPFELSFSSWKQTAGAPGRRAVAVKTVF
jgi:hypothetical protein